MGPQTQSRIRNEEDVFAAYLIGPVLEFVRIIAFKHRVEIAVRIAHAFYFLPREMARTPGDLEPAFGTGMNQVRGRAKIIGEFRIFFHGFQRIRRAVIAVLADECIDHLVFAELAHTRSENDQLRAISQSHARAIDSFVADPGAVELAGIEVNHRLLHLLFDDLEVDLEAQFSCLEEALDIISNVEAAHGESAAGLAADDRLHINDRQMAKELVRSMVEHGAHRILCAAHNAFHAVDSAEIVAAVDAFTAAGAYENVLGVVGHADYFMRHDLADGKNQIEAAA